MNIFKTTCAAGLLAVVAAGCGHSDYKKTSTGLVYDIVKDGKGEPFKHSEFVKLHYKFVLNDDSVLQSTFGYMPGYVPVDTTNLKTHSFVDILPLLRVGDSTIVVSYIDTLRKMGQIPPTDTLFKPGSTVKAYVKVLQRFKDEGAVQADFQQEQEKETQREIAGLSKYLTDKKIAVQKSPKGVFVQMKTPGNGSQVVDGKQVAVLYKGVTQGGNFFDSSRNGQPIELVVGAGQVIPGWDDGLKLLKQGSKATLYIPSMLAYGPRPQTPAIKPFENLVFDVEVVSVKDAPAPPAAAPGQAPPPPGGGQ
jgi:FKBP-type peptidyl-prolyl cis-trans isomerase FkpA